MNEMSHGDVGRPERRSRIQAGMKKVKTSPWRVSLNSAPINPGDYGGVRRDGGDDDDDENRRRRSAID
jgi:hypothetical protein